MQHIASAGSRCSGSAGYCGFRSELGLMESSRRGTVVGDRRQTRHRIQLYLQLWLHFHKSNVELGAAAEFDRGPDHCSAGTRRSTGQRNRHG